jgi:rhodanese-related sulfurtransferase
MGNKGSTGPARLLAAAALALALALAGCGGGGAGGAGSTTAGAGGAAAPRAGSIAPEDARALMAADTTLLVLDVREPAEWNDQWGHIEGSRQIPVGQLEARAGEIEAWKDRTVIVVCTVGQRSGHAARMLASKGFRDARNMEGGLVAWRGKGY